MTKISIIMGIYNCSATLEDAVRSIQKQTYTNWEMIMCDDGSMDCTYEVAQKLARSDPRIILLRNEKNMGLNYTLNRCLQVASGEYIARMDGDDLCSEERLEKELNALESHPDMVIVSTNMLFFDEHGIWGKTNVKEYPLPADLLKTTQFCHAACMVKASAYKAVGGYSVSKRLLRVEDYHLWIKMYAKGYRGMNLLENMYQMRDDRSAQKRKKYRYRLNEAYVKAVAVKRLQLPAWGYLYCLKPLLIGLMPAAMYRFLHKAIR